MPSPKINHKKSQEILSHFQCDQCHKWWTIGDAPQDKQDWYCPWCGRLGAFSETFPESGK